MQTILPACHLISHLILKTCVHFHHYISFGYSFFGVDSVVVGGGAAATNSTATTLNVGFYTTLFYFAS